jgi:hypothetical protein
VFDPIDAFKEAYQELQNKETKGVDKAMRVGGKLAGEVFSNVPLGQTIAAMYPEYGGKVGDIELPTRRELFGSNDPTRYGTGPLIAKAVTDPGKYLLLPFGGAQVDKTYNALQALHKEGSYKNGKLKYPVERTMGNTIKGLMFGPGAFEETATYYKNNRRPLSDKQTEEFLRHVSNGADPQKEYDKMMAERKARGEKKKTSSKSKESWKKGW